MTRSPNARLAWLSLAMFFGVTLWFSATAANAPIVAEFGLTTSQTAWLTMAVQGGFVIGTLLSALGIKPVVFKSDADAAKAVTTESKMFSIYADGIVPGYQRMTKVRIHEVVDFRNAPPPGTAIGPNGLQTNTGLPGSPPLAPTATGTPGAPGVPGGNPNGIAGALLPNPAGTVIYFRIE